MKYKDFLLKYEYIFFNTFLITCLSVSLINDFINLKVHSVPLCIISAVTAFIITIIYNYRKKPILYIIIGIAAIIFSAVVIALKWSLLKGFGNILNWFVGYGKSGEKYIFGYAIIVISLFSLIISILAFVFQNKIFLQ